MRRLGLWLWAIAGCQHSVPAFVAEPDAGPSGPRCVITSPKPEGGYLNGSVDEHDEQPGLQVSIEVSALEFDASSIAIEIIDGDGKRPTEALPKDGRASFDANLIEGAVEIVARCRGEGTELSDELRAEVDFTGCELMLSQPAVDQQFVQSDDLDADTEGVQIAVVGSVAGEQCEQVTLCAGQGATLPAPVPVEDESFELMHTLSGQTDQKLCVEVADIAGNVTQVEQDLRLRICSASEVLCDRECVDDTDSNPAHCGATCTACPGVPNGAPQCVDGVCGVACDEDYHWEQDGCRFRPGCSGLEAGCCGEDCCAADAIEAAQGQDLQFQRGYDASGNSMGVEGFQAVDPDAIVSLDGFALDRYEVTVGRFRRFLADYDDWAGQQGVNPRTDDGEHPRIPNSGWQWTPSPTVHDGVLNEDLEAVPPSQSDFERRLAACGSQSTWTDEAGSLAAEAMPINCLSFFEAFLFCMWDGGRLPTEAEWNLVAAAGGEQRAYPWSKPDPGDLSIDMSLATYDRSDSEGPETVCAKPAGAGRWGTQGLSGNVYEWVRDTGEPTGIDTYVSSSSNPCDLTADSDPNTRHFLRGGSYKFEESYLRTAYRELRGAITRIADVGVRCARPLAAP